MRIRTFAVVLMMFLTACVSEGPLTHAELVERADAICADAFTEIRAIGADLPEPSDASAARWAEALEQMIPILEGMVEELRGLEPPSSDAAGFAALLDAYDGTLAHLEETRRAAAGGDSDAMSQPSEQTTLAWIDADQAARDLGLEDCTLLEQDSAIPSSVT